jgi:hypothetical protein
MRNTPAALLLAPLFLLAACSGGGGSATGGAGTGTLTVEATDAFLAHSQIDTARVYVTEIQAHQSATANSGFLTLYSGPAQMLELSDLRNGVVQQLVQATVPSGTYHQVRLIFSEAYLKLVNGNEYSTALGNLSLTSQATSGLKVFISPSVVIGDGANEAILLDFDLTKTFHPIPANDPLNATSYKLMPVVRASSNSATGAVRGVVTKDDGTGIQVAVVGAGVYVLPPGEPDPTGAITSTATGADGGYVVLGLDPGSYDVLAMEGALQGRVNGVPVTAGSVTDADIVLQ